MLTKRELADLLEPIIKGSSIPDSPPPTPSERIAAARLYADIIQDLPPPDEFSELVRVFGSAEAVKAAVEVLANGAPPPEAPPKRRPGRPRKS